MLAAGVVWVVGEPQGQGESARRNQMVVEESLGRSVALVVLREVLPQVKLVCQGHSARSVFQAHQAQREYLQLVWVA